MHFNLHIIIKKKLKQFMTTYVIIEYDGLCGGLGDRLTGLVSAILMAKILQKQLLIKWEHPNIRGVFDISAYDYHRHKISLNNIISLNTIDNRFKFENLLSHEPIHIQWHSKNILLRCNQEIAFFLYQNRHIGYKGHYEQDMLQTYKSLLKTYLKPLNANPTLHHPYIGVQLRCGDAYMHVGNHRPVSDINVALRAIALHIQSNLSTYKNVYVTSDHPTATSQLKQLLPQHSVVDLPASRVHLERTKTSTSQLQALLRDLNTLVEADQLIISAYSNFGRAAALMSTRSATILGFNPPSFQVTNVPLSSLFTKHPTKHAMFPRNVKTKNTARLFKSALPQSSSSPRLLLSGKRPNRNGGGNNRPNRPNRPNRNNVYPRRHISSSNTVPLTSALFRVTFKQSRSMPHHRSFSRNNGGVRSMRKLKTISALTSRRRHNIFKR